MSQTSRLKIVDAVEGTRGSSKQAFSLSAFSHLVREGYVKLNEDSSAVEVKRWLLADLLRPMLLSVNFDEEYYRKVNPDLAEAERSGTIASLHEHYLEFGYFEHRLPCFVEVDITFYAHAYPDMKLDLSEPSARLAQNHFEHHGFKEGRIPSEGWSFADLTK
jgi:hypothetical protein